MGHKVLEQIRGGLIVSCQALDHEPLHGAGIMRSMAVAAMRGGAVGIRANGPEDIRSIRQEVDLPVIGIIKKNYPDSEIYITPTIREAELLADTGVEIISLDCTERKRPGGISLEELYREIRERFPKLLLMADCSTYQEGMKAAVLGFDLVATTMCGYTPYTRETKLPGVDLVRKLADDCGKPVIGEGGIWSPEQLAAVMDAGAFAAVVGTAITRPMEITKRFVAALPARTE